MMARRYQNKDYEMIESWMKKRGRPHWVPRSWLPKAGFMVDDVAVVFLGELKGTKVGLMDFFVSNPDASEAARMEAYRLGHELLEDHAKKLGLEIILCNTQIPKVMGVVLSLGYKGDPEPFYGFRKSLTQESGDIKDGSERVSSAVPLIGPSA